MKIPNVVKAAASFLITNFPPEATGIIKENAARIFFFKKKRRRRRLKLLISYTLKTLSKKLQLLGRYILTMKTNLLPAIIYVTDL